MASPSAKPLLMDKLPLPVTIGFIRGKVKEGEVVRIGNKIFPKIMCVGLVTSYRSVHSLSSVEYIVSDPSDSAASVKEISVLHREEPSSSKEQVEFPNGTSVFISGKLTRFKGSVAIQASSMRKLICPDEYDCLKMETFLALQFHTKNPSVQTPVRRSLQGGANLTAVQSPLSAPSSGKRLSSSSSTFTPTPKRPNVANNALPGRTVGTAARREAISRSMTGKKELPEKGKADTAAVKEAGSQDSFEDAVFLEK